MFGAGACSWQSPLSLSWLWVSWQVNQSRLSLVGCVRCRRLVGICVLVLDRSKHVRFEIADGRLFVRGDIFCWRFPLSSMNLGPSVVLDLTQWPGFQAAAQDHWNESSRLSIRGIHAAEWPTGDRFFLSDLHRVLCILMNDGKFLLLSCQEPEALLELLVAEKRA